MSISSNPRGSSKELAGNPENAQIYQPTAKLQQLTTFFVLSNLYWSISWSSHVEGRLNINIVNPE